jgi:hypothetical protein
MEIEKYELQRMLNDAAEFGAKKALLDLGLSKPFLSFREASNVYGSGRVNRWIKEGLIQKYKDGDTSSTIRLDRMQLDILARSSNRNTYLSQKEMKSK